MVGSSVAEDGVMHFGQWIDDLHILVGEMVHLNIHFPSPKPKLNLEAFERRFRSASLIDG